MDIDGLFDLVKRDGLWSAVLVVIVYKGPDYIRAFGDVRNGRRQLDNEHCENMKRLNMNRKKTRKEKEDA